MTPIQSKTILGKLQRLVFLRGEKLSDYPNLAEWVKEFQYSGYDYDTVMKIIDSAKNLERYNPLAYGDLISNYDGKHRVFQDFKTAIERLNNENEELSKKVLELEAQISHNEYCADVERFLKDNQFMAEKCKQREIAFALVFVKRALMEMKSRNYTGFEFWLNQRQTEYERELEKINEYFKN